MTTIGSELVGREAELDSLVAFLDDRAGLPAGAVIEGPAGAGKTTLWRAAVEQARSTDYLVLACRPLGSEVQLSLAALTDLLEPVVATVLPALPAPQRRALEVALLLRESGGQPPDQRAIAAGVLNALRALASEAPVLVAIDDAQWLDAQSAEILEYALRRLGDARVAVLASTRTQTPTMSEPGPLRGLHLAAVMQRPPTRVDVGPLSLGAMNRLLRMRTSLEFNRRTLQRIHETSGGNPFYALELARAMGEGRSVEATSGAPGAGEPLVLSSGLNELLADRLGGLAKDVRDALFVAAAAAEPTLELVTQVLAMPGEGALGPAIRASIVRIQGDAIEFVHPLLAAAAYAGIDPDARRRWHAGLAAASADPEAKARHLALARPGPDADVATILHDAAQRAQLRGAPGDAAELFAVAIERLPSGAAVERTTWTVEAGPILLAVGDTQHARTLLESAVQEMPAGPARSEALLLLADVIERDAGSVDRVLELIEQAIFEAGSDIRRRCAALLDREVIERARDRIDLALGFALEALALAEQAGDEFLLALAHARTAELEVRLGLGGDPVARYATAIELDVRVHVDAQQGAPTSLAACLIRAGRLDEARHILIDQRRRTIAEGDETSRQWLCLFLTELEWLAGRWDDAAAFAEEGLGLAEQSGLQVFQGMLRTVLSLLEASRGDPDRARLLGQSTRDDFAVTGDIGYANYARQVVAFLDMSLGRAASAHEAADTYAVERAVEGSKRLSFIGDEIEALVTIGDVDRAAELTGVLRARGDALGRPPLGATAARCEALVRGSRGDLDGAALAATRAVEAFTALRYPFERARSLLVLGEVQRRAKQRRAARETLTDAVEAFERLGAHRWAARAEAERARIGGRSTIEGLTETELRVAQLVAEGRSNKEVAAELFVSVRAVESNLSKVYAKLGIRSRTELARRI